MIGGHGVVVRLPVYRPVDFRKGHDGLAVVASHEFGIDIHSGVIVVFRSKGGDRIKMLLFDGTGLVMTYKRLERGRFVWPARAFRQHSTISQGKGFSDRSSPR